MSKNEQNYVKEAFDSNWIAPAGPHIKLFEDKLSEISDNLNIAVLSSGTAAIHLALILLEVERDDCVICSSFSFSASVNPVIYQGAHPIFIDSEKDTWNMDPVLLEQAIAEKLNCNKTSNPIAKSKIRKTKAFKLDIFLMLLVCLQFFQLWHLYLDQLNH